MDDKNKEIENRLRALEIMSRDNSKRLKTLEDESRKLKNHIAESLRVIQTALASEVT